VVSYGRPVAQVLALAERLSGEGINLEIIDLRTISPIDKTTVLESVAKTGRAVVVHEAVEQFGVGATVSALIAEDLHGTLRAPVARVGSRNCPVPFSKPLEEAFMYNEDRIEAAIRKVL
jgi:pyruvate dehydrogenase E1 component beta subunit